MRGRAAATVFSLLFGAAYFVCFLFEIVPFRYYPTNAVFHIAEQPAAAGPPILWFGWMVAAAAMSGVVALVVPVRWVDRLWPGVSWSVPTAVMVAMLIYERRWFF